MLYILHYRYCGIKPKKLERIICFILRGMGSQWKFLIRE